MDKISRIRSVWRVKNDVRHKCKPFPYNFTAVSRHDVWGILDKTEGKVRAK